MQRRRLIDDARALSAMLRRGFAHAGYAVDVAESGMVGLTIARERPPWSSWTS